MEYGYQDQLKSQIFLLPEDFAGEVPYAFGGPCPENNRLNAEMVERATKRARKRLGIAD